MRIKRLAIKNLGKHKELTATLDGSVVGLLGANGSGKSTILKLIHFLMTGWTPTRETQESFIRKVDPELDTEPSFGTAEMDFSSDGEAYRIFRKIGSGTSRRLAKLDEQGNEIKSETVTRADEIQAKLNEILGADKYAIDSAVFPEQGALDKILFGQQAEREELLVRLLLLGHMQKVADVAAGKIKTLGSEIQDFSVLHDELQSSRNKAEEDLAAAESAFSKLLPWTTEEAQFESWLSLEEKINNTALELRSASNTVTDNTLQIQNICTTQSAALRITIDSAASADAWVTKYRNTISSNTNKKQKLHNDLNDLNNVIKLNETIENLSNEIAAKESSLPPKPDASYSNELSLRYNDQKEIARIKASIAKEKDNILKESLKFKAAEEDNIIWSERLNIFQKQKDTEAETLALYSTIIDTCEAAHAHCSSECPVCGTNMTGIDINARLSHYRGLYGPLSEKLKATKAEIDKAVNESNRHYKEMTRAFAAMNQARTNLAQQEKELENLHEEDMTELLGDIEADTQNRNEYFRATGELNALLKKVQEAKAELARVAPARLKELYALDADTIKQEISTLEVKLQGWDKALTKITDVNRELSTLSTIVTTYEGIVSRCETDIIQLEKKKNDLKDSFTDRLKSMLSSGASAEKIKEDLRDKNTRYTECKVRAHELKVNADNIKRRLQEIEQKIKLDEDKRQVIKDLQALVAAFSRHGIPMTYVQHKFDDLVALTQENLEIMDANFAIIPHPEKPVSLQFYRIDEPGQVVFEHDKLSGGQKVRLSIAFLLAVQQLIIPELGFLVLDEPSTHLDDEARENLKDLLLNLNQQLQATDTQIIVCDHARELEPAFVKTIKL